jgi:hypothetical protein
MDEKSIWVVEMQNDVTHKYEPTVGVGLDYYCGSQELTRWKNNNPDDKFRLKEYAPV